MIERDDIIKYWQTSLDEYQKSLDIEERVKTRENYDFVKSKLEDIEQEQEDEHKKEHGEKNTKNNQEKSDKQQK
jgi:hypothetical protein